MIDAGEGLKDDGVSVNGFPWIARTVGPAAAVDAATDLTISGLLAVAHTTGAPTTGTWIAGDRTERNPPIVGQPRGHRYTGSAWASDGAL
ncbi:hypothetical protein D3C85_1442700 [compost metagenome]